MAYTKADLGDFVEALYQTENFEQAFRVYEKHVLKLGFEGVLYTYIPRILLDSNFGREPIYKVSQNYSPAYIKHYFDARFDRNDPLIRAVKNGTTEPIDWRGELCKSYMNEEKTSQAVIETARDYGIVNGLTLPLMSGEQGIAGASFISRDAQYYYNKHKNENLEQLKLCTKLFHDMVISHTYHMNHFIQISFKSLSETEKQLLQKLAQGKSAARISFELSKSEKYLEKVMLRIRQKLSGVSTDDAPKINRNQVMYYAGLLNLLK